MRVRAGRVRKGAVERVGKPQAASGEAIGRRWVVEGRVVAVLPDGRARVEVASGEVIDCRCAQAIDVGWLRAALARGPVDAEASIGVRGGSLCAVFPGPEHASVVAERVALESSQSVEIKCGQSSITMKKDGRVRIRGRDVAARGARVARLQGHTVRLN
jgi:hypothetical protein